MAEQEPHATEERAEIAAVRERTERELQATQVSLLDQLAAAQQELAEARRDAAAAREELKAARMGATAGLPSSAQSRATLLSDADSTGGQATRGTRAEPQTNGDVVGHAAPSRREGATVRDRKAASSLAVAAAAARRYPDTILPSRLAPEPHG